MARRDSLLVTTPAHWHSEPIRGAGAWAPSQRPEQAGKVNARAAFLECVEEPALRSPVFRLPRTRRLPLLVALIAILALPTCTKSTRSEGISACLNQETRTACSGNWEQTGLLGPGSLASVFQNPSHPSRLAINSSNRSGVVLWNADQGIIERTLPGIADAGWSGDGSRLVTPGPDDTINIWNPDTGQLLATIPFHGTMAWSPDGIQLAIISLQDDAISIWRTDQSVLVQTIHTMHIGPVATVAWSPDGTRLVSTGAGTRACDTCPYVPDETLKVWDSSSGALVLNIQAAHDWTVFGASWSPDSRRLASTSIGAETKIWNVDTGALIHRLVGVTGAARALWSPDGAFILVSYDAYGAADVWNVDLGALINRFASPTHLHRLQWSPDSSLILVAGRYLGPDDFLSIQRATTNEVVHSIQWPNRGLLVAGWSGPSQLVTASNDQLVRVWNAESGEVLRTLDGYVSAIQSLAWAPTADQVVFASANDVFVADARSGEIIRRLPGV